MLDTLVHKSLSQQAGDLSCGDNPRCQEWYCGGPGGGVHRPRGQTLERAHNVTEPWVDSGGATRVVALDGPSRAWYP